MGYVVVVSLKCSDGEVYEHEYTGVIHKFESSVKEELEECKRDTFYARRIVDAYIKEVY